MIRRSQPQQFSGVDFGQPFARGLVSVLLPVDRHLVDAVSGAILSATGTIASSFIAGARGVKTDGAASYFSRAITGFGSTGEVSLLWFGAASPGANQFAVALGSSSDSNPILALASDPTTANKARLFVRANSGAGVADLSSSNPCFDGQSRSLVGVVSASRAAIVRDGKIDATFTPTLATTTVDRLAVGALLRTSAGSFFSGSHGVAAVWNRGLSDAEAVELSRNPWQLFRPQRSAKLYFLPSSGGVSGAIAAAEDADVAALSAQISGAGSLASAEDADVLAASGSVVTNVSGAQQVVEGADAFAASGDVVIPDPSGVLSVNEGADAFAATGTSDGVEAVSYAGGYTVRVGKRKFKVDPLDSMSLKAVIDAVQDEAEEVAAVVEPVARPAVVARAQVKPVEVPKTNREDAKAFAAFLARVRGEYEAAIRTAMIIRLMREAEDDDEEAILLLM